jgi:hypothetical protein
MSTPNKYVLAVLAFVNLAFAIESRGEMVPHSFILLEADNDG